MKIVLVSKCSLHFEQYVDFKVSVLISPSKSLISSRWVTYIRYRSKRFFFWGGGQGAVRGEWRGAV